MQVYAHFGISLPHSSASQSGYGKSVSYSEAQPGDLIFYANGGTVHHVALYIGGGQIVHAKGAAYGICINSATYNTIYSVRRIL